MSEVSGSYGSSSSRNSISDNEGSERRRSEPMSNAIVVVEGLSPHGSIAAPKGKEHEVDEHKIAEEPDKTESIVETDPEAVIGNIGSSGPSNSNDATLWRLQPRPWTQEFTNAMEGVQAQRAEHRTVKRIYHLIAIGATTAGLAAGICTGAAIYYSMFQDDFSVSATIGYGVTSGVMGGASAFLTWISLKLSGVLVPRTEDNLM